MDPVLQPEVDPKRISLIGHSEGTLYAPRLAMTFVKIEVAIELANHTTELGGRLLEMFIKRSHITQSESVLIILTRVPNMRRGL